MKLPLPSSIKGLVTLIVLMALLPAVGFIVYSSLATVRLDLNESNKLAMRTAKSILLEQAQIVGNTRVLLFTLSQLAEVREKRIKESESLFRNILEQMPSFADVRLLDLDGNVLAAGDSLTKDLPDEAMKAFRDGLASPGFSVHELRAPREGEPARLNCQIPVMSGRETIAVLMASVKLEVAETRLAELAEKHVSNLFVVDANGNILVSYPQKSDTVRTLAQFSPSAWERIRQSSEGSGVFADTDARRIVFEKMSTRQSPTSPEILLVLNISTETLYSHMLSEIALSVMVLAGVLLLAMLVTFRLCNKNLLTPMRRLLDTANKLKDGKLETRIGAVPMPTELKVLAESMDTMAESLEHRDKELIKARDIASIGTQAKTDFLANMSHEIRTPMNAILGMTYLTRQGELTDQQRIYMDNIHNEADKLLVIINDILDFSKIEAGKLTIEHIAFRLPSFLDVIVQYATEEAGKKGIEFQYVPPVVIPDYVFGDPHHTRQLLNNLTGNIIRFTASGTVTLALECGCPAPGSAPAAPKSMQETGFAVPPATAPETAPGTAPEAGSGTGAATESESSGETVSEASLAANSGQADATRNDKELVLLQFTISRSGEGMGEKELSALIPDAADDENEHSGGVNLNLAITRKLVTLLGGEITARPARSGGSLIHISLPVVKARAEDVQETAQTAPPASSGESGGNEQATEANPLQGVRVLLAEDNPINQQIAEELLSGNGAEVTVASNGEEALVLLENPPSGFAFNIVFMDLQMPVLDGIAATIRIRQNKKFASLPIIAMTAHSQDEQWEECKNAGMNDFVAKPLNVPELLLLAGKWAKRK